MNIFQVLIRILEYNFFYIKTKKKDGSIKKENRLPFYSTIAYPLTRMQRHARRGVDEALSDGSDARHCNNIRLRNSPGAIRQREDQEPGCSPLDSFPSGSV
jgi:hypothetical protein